MLGWDECKTNTASVGQTHVNACSHFKRIEHAQGRPRIRGSTRLQVEIYICEAPAISKRSLVILFKGIINSDQVDRFAIKLRGKVCFCAQKLSRFGSSIDFNHSLHSAGAARHIGGAQAQRIESV